MAEAAPDDPSKLAATLAPPAAAGRDPAPGSADEALGAVFNIPNQLTLARLAISLGFFAILVLENYKVLGAARALWLNFSIAIFALAALTDFLDGYLARRWNMTSSFGRVADPIVDKVFICGSFVLLTETCDLVAPWIPVLLLTREFIIAGLRSFMESLGHAFGAGTGGKLKMAVQSATVPALLAYEANFRDWDLLRWLCIALLGLTILLTFTSSFGYILKARSLLRGRRS